MVLIATITIFVIILTLWIKNKKRWDLGNKIPGPKAVPFIGNIDMANLTPEKLFVKMNCLQKTYKDGFRLWLGPNLWIFLNRPEHITKVLNDQTIPKAEIFQLLKPLIGTGLLISNEKKWFRRRKALLPAFNIGVLYSFIERFSIQADVLVSKIKKSPTGCLEITPYLLLCMLDGICETAMGVKINAQNDPESAYVKAFHDASHIIFKQMANPLLQIDWIFKLTGNHGKVKKAIRIIHDLTDKVIREKREKLVAKSDSPFDEEFAAKRRYALLDVLLQSTVDGIPLTDEDIREEVNTFLFAGIDTTKSALSFLLYNLAKYEDVQNEVVEEILSEGLTNPEDIIKWQNINNMPFLDLVIKESLRFYTTVPVTGRETIADMTIGEYKIPIGSTLWINIYGMSHDEKLFSEPEIFKPRRFEKPSNDGTNDGHTYAYMPFSGGPHVCIGKKYALFIMKTIAVKILMNFKLSLQYPDEELELISEMVLKSRTGINISFETRI